MFDSSYRYAVYRQYTWWVNGRRLGKFQRRRIPACVVHEILDSYPERRTEDYHGFQYSLLQDLQESTWQVVKTSRLLVQQTDSPKW